MDQYFPSELLKEKNTEDAQMNKEQTRALLESFQLQKMLNAMERDGFSWETVQTIKDNLRLVIMQR